MIVKLKDVYEIDDESAYEVVNDLLELLNMVDLLSKEQKETTRLHALKLNNVFMEVLDTNNAIVLATSVKQTRLIICEMDYLSDGRVYGAKNIMCEKEDGVATHFELEVII